MSKKFILMSLVCIFCIILISCNKEKVFEEKIHIDVPNNIVVEKNIEKLKYYTIQNGTLEEIILPIDGDIQIINKENNLLIYTSLENNKTNINIIHSDEKTQIQVEGQIDNIIVNKSCTRLLYKVMSSDNTIKYESIDLKDFKTVTLGDNIVISGELVNFIDDNSIVFYGVNNEEKKSGIFKFDIVKNEYKLLHQVSKAFIEYIKVLDSDRVLFIKSLLNGTKETYVYTISSGDMELITDKIQQIDRIYLEKDKLYFIGSLCDSRLSLYSLTLTTKDLKRLIFDFPKNIVENSDVILNDNKLFFIGYDKDESNSDIYTYDLKNRVAKIIDRKKSIYRIIDESK